MNGRFRQQLHRGALQFRRLLKSATAVILSISMAGCGILGDGEVNIVTAPPIVNTKVVALDYFGNNDDNRFKIGGTGAFYLLPGIENHPDYLQDFSCLDYTNDGYFVYYYCAPAYITPAQIIAYKGTSGTLSADTDMWPAINRDKQKSTCDAMIFMAYNPYTRAYKVIDAQSYSKDTADSDNKARAKDTDGTDISLQVSTGIEFYSNHTYDFHTLSHCYGCKISRYHRYFIFDQSGGAKVYDEKFSLVQSLELGATIRSKVQEETDKLKAAASGDAKSTAEIVSDLGDGGQDMKDAIADMQKATGKQYSTGQSIQDLHLSSLIKSAVMDSYGVMYLTLMLYTGESPWATDVLYNRVLSVYMVDLGSDALQFVSRNKTYEKQIDYMRKHPDADYDKLKQGDTYTFVIEDWEFIPGTLNMRPVTRYEETQDKFGGFECVGSDGMFNSYIAGVSDMGQRNDVYDVLYDYAKRSLFENSNVAISKLFRTNTSFGFYALSMVSLLAYIPSTWRMISGVNQNGSLYDNNKATSVLKLTEQEIEFIRYALLAATTSDTRAASKVFAVFWHAAASNRLQDAVNEATMVITGWAARNILKSYMDRIERIIADFKSKYGVDPRETKGHKDVIQLASFGDVTVWETIENSMIRYGVMPTMGAWNPRTHWNDTNGLPTEQEANNARNFTNSGLSQSREIGSWAVNRGDDFLPAQTFSLIHTSSNVREMWVNCALRTAKINMFPATADPNKQEDHGLAWVEPCAWSDSVYDQNGRLVVDGSKYPIAYRLRFPKGTYALFCDMMSVEGSTNSSLGLGALLFADDARTVNNQVQYTSKLRYVRESGIYFTDSNVPGAAVDTGCLTLDANSTDDSRVDRLLKEGGFKKEILLLLTEEGVKFYFPTIFARVGSNAYVIDWYTGSSVRGKIESVDCTYNATSEGFFFTYKQMLTSTGFTSHMEGTQAESSDNLSNVLQDKTGDNSANQTVKDSAAKLSKTLNSSRVGTLQAATSFTALSNFEYLVSSYDTGLVVMNITTTSLGSIDVLPIRTGSYYQTFPVDGKSGYYKLLGFDTEDYQYGSMDLARARVYDENLAEGKNAVYATAMLQFLDQYAIDYVRRLYRTRRDKDNNMVVINYEDDYSGEAASEKRLFAATSSEEDAIRELKSLESRRKVPHTEAAEEYLRMLRRRVAAQQTALNEIFDITMASKLGETKLKTDPYWVDVRARLQNISDVQALQELIVEIMTNDDLMAYMNAADKQFYNEVRETLNVEQETKENRTVLANIEDNFDPEAYEQKLADHEEVQKEDYPLKQSEEYAANGKEPVSEKEQQLEKNMHLDEQTQTAVRERQEMRAEVLDDAMQLYLQRFKPVKPEDYYAPDGTKAQAITEEKEQEAWENYLATFADRVNPANLAVGKAKSMEDLADLAYSGNTVAESQRELVRPALIERIKNATTLLQVEEALFVERMKLPQYIKYYSEYTQFAGRTYESDIERNKAMRAADWYRTIKEDLLQTALVDAILKSQNVTWEGYVQRVVSGVTGQSLRNDVSGEVEDVYLTTARYFAQAMEFMCEGAGTVTTKQKIELVADLMIYLGSDDTFGAEGAEEAVLNTMLQLPNYTNYRKDYEAFVKKMNEGKKPEGKETTATASAENLNYTSAERRVLLQKEKFYQETIGHMQQSELLQSYLSDQKYSWEQYMASLATMAREMKDEKIAAEVAYDGFVPYKMPEKKEDKDSSGSGGSSSGGGSTGNGAPAGSSGNSGSSGSTGNGAPAGSSGNSGSGASSSFGKSSSSSGSSSGSGKSSSGSGKSRSGG